MKIIGINLLMMGCLISFSLSIDIFQEFDVSQALYNAVSPFRVMEVAELIICTLFFSFSFFAESVYPFIKKEKSNQNK